MSADKPPEPDYAITVRPLPDTVPATARSRRLLKALLRGYGMKCISVSEVPSNSKPSRDGGGGRREEVSAG